MKLWRKMDLQLFADPEEEEEEDIEEEEEEDDEDDLDDLDELDEDAEGDDEEEEEDSHTYRSQQEVDDAIKRRLARQERKIAKLFGTKNLEEAAELARAGAAVSRASGVKPGEVVSRLSKQATTPAPGTSTQSPGADTGSAQELREIRGLLENERVQKVRTTQEKEARKEFGKLYDEHKEDIEEKAEDMGVSLVDAAAIVLRPKLKDVYAERTKKQKEIKKKRRVEGSGEPPVVGANDYKGKLSDQQIRVARKMNMSPKEYYEQGLQTGLFKK